MKNLLKPFQTTSLQHGFDAYKRHFDFSPDEFYFNVCGLSGRFYFPPHGGAPIISCSENVKVEVLPIETKPKFKWRCASALGLHQLNDMPTFNGFVIIREDGTRYTFGTNNPEDDSCIEWSINFLHQVSPEWSASAWHLKKIEYSNGREVSFSYGNSGYSLNLKPRMWKRTIKSYCNGNVSSYSENGNTSSFDGWVEGYLLRPVYLEKITTDGITLDFIRSESNEKKYKEENISSTIYKYGRSACAFFPIFGYTYGGSDGQLILDSCRWDKLDAIKLHTAEGIAQKVVFSYNNTSAERLFLNKIALGYENSTGFVLDGTYSFNYYKQDLVPDYFSKQIDNWGYYNGGSAENLYGDRKAKLEETRYGSLQRIRYPTGGYTEFEYELNVCGKQVSEPRNSCMAIQEGMTVGGLRIASISNFSSDNRLLGRKTYTYFAPHDNSFALLSENSSGVLSAQVQHAKTVSYHPMAMETDLVAVMPPDYVEEMLLDGNNILTISSNERHIGYSYVQEIEEGAGATYYSFTNYDTGQMDELSMTPLFEGLHSIMPYTSRSQERGLMTRKLLLDGDGNPVEDNAYEYTKSVNNHTLNAYYVRLSRPLRNGRLSAVATAASYCIHTYRMLLKRHSQTIFHKNEIPYNITVDFMYDNYNKINYIDKFDSNGRRIHTRYSYVYNGTSEAEKALTEANRILPLWQQTTVDGILVSGDRWRYGFFEGSPELAAWEQADTKGKFSPKITVLAYDKFRNPLAYKTETDEQIVSLWSYSGRYPVAIIRNATLNDVVSSFSEGMNAINAIAIGSVAEESELDHLRNAPKLKNSHVKTALYRCLIGIKSMTDEQGQTHYYDYDGMGRLVRIFRKRFGQEETLQSSSYEYKTLLNSIDIASDR